MNCNANMKMVCVCLLTACSLAGQSWLDKAAYNWNRSGETVPRPRRSGGNDPECKDTMRRPSTAEDRAVAASGWTLFGPQETFGTTLVLHALSGVDGMCRPLGYQAFVFVKGQFAGTMSPGVMDSRSDGAESAVHVSTQTTLMGEFQRYKNSDPLCCPSRTTRVMYKIVTVQGRPLLVPDSIITTAR